LKNLGVEALDLVQLHCPPTQVYYMPEGFGILGDLTQAGKLRYCGVSVEKVEEALKVIAFPNGQSVQIIFNLFRQRPAGLFFGLAQQKQVAIPGAKNRQQAIDNAATSDLPPLPHEVMHGIAAIYNRQIKPLVHQRW
jgi:aryl-alcohol dehydrogenase-like predicted oxidoreductase